ncbi:MAG: diacylglycerol kinase family protein [Lentimicrobium sp.]|nr:diacylglycerol kinase family protein [Lentimicrobium sp.]
MNSGKSNFLKCTDSFKVAFKGLFLAVRTERHMQIQVTAVIFVSVAGVCLKLEYYEWLTILSLFAIVISTELINTSIEKLCDFVQPDLNDQIRNIKDISAGAVLWTSIIAAIAGLLILIPKIYLLLTNH